MERRGISLTLLGIGALAALVALVPPLRDGVTSVLSGDAGRLRAELLALPGVGPWTSNYVDLRCRADRDVFLPGDLGVRRALERLAVPASPREAAAIATRWAPHRSLALAHLWAAYLDL